MTDRRPLLLRDTRGMTMVELCIVIVIIGILLVVSVATLLRARTSSNEAAAVGAMRTINSAQFAYASECGGGTYASSLTVLGTKPPGNGQAYLADDLGSAVTAQRNGYRFTIQAGAGGAAVHNDCNGVQTQTKYYATGVPVSFGTTGSRAFATTEAGSVWQSMTAVPPAEPLEPPDQLAQ